MCILVYSSIIQTNKMYCTLVLTCVRAISGNIDWGAGILAKIVEGRDITALKGRKEGG